MGVLRLTSNQRSTQTRLGQSHSFTPLGVSTADHGGSTYTGVTKQRLLDLTWVDRDHYPRYFPDSLTNGQLP